LQRALKAADTAEVDHAIEALRAVLAARPAARTVDGNNKDPDLVGASHVSEFEEVRTG